ncbi:uncharacterized protein E0L32_003309 [Thyridium curvatum]|uniref:Centromere protein Scm3 n=1 Tax=Thyridium curvatum TaxID=1093900 RepID=A0A507BJG0_9PEZI|nr:uncharacterized protein E0L32_003309 [Thyridium curvatum]TPX17191.1 hypothetical protein E0L32_003309 [Thyridium curvatum]
MEPPAKRARIAYAPYDDDDDDELNLDPEELAAKQDPGYQLQRSREVAAHKLKSTFESIFEKYERDFTDVGDEIDLRTGEIVVDNGHLRSMRSDDEEDQDAPAGQGLIAAKSTDVFREEDSSDEEDRILHGGRPVNEPSAKDAALIAAPPAQDRHGQLTQAWPRASSLAGQNQRPPDTGFPSRLQFMGRPLSFASFGPPAFSADPMWSAPELPVQTFTSGFRPFSGIGMVKAPVTRTVIRRALPMAVESMEDEDDILLGVVDRIPREAKTPRTKLAAGSRTTERRIGEAIGGADLEMQEADTAPQMAIKTKPQSLQGNNVVVKHVSQKSGRKSLSTLEQGPNTIPLAKPGSKPKQKTSLTKRAKVKPAVVVVQSPSLSGEQAQTLANEDEETLPEISATGKQLVIANPRKRRRANSRKETVVTSITTGDSELVLSTNSTTLQGATNGDESVSRPFPAERLVIELDHGPELPVSQVVEAEAGVCDKDNAEKPGATVKTGSQAHQRTTTQETFKRNILDPSYGFSDDEGGLIIRRPTKSKDRQATSAMLPSEGAPVVDLLEDSKSTTQNSTAEIRRRSRKQKLAPLASSPGRAPTQDQQESNKQQVSKAQAKNAKERAAETADAEQERQSPSKHRTASPQKPTTKDCITVVDPTTPQTQSRTSRLNSNSNPPSSSKTGIISLISDSEEDELSFEAGASSASTKRKPIPYRPKADPATRRVLFGHNSGTASSSAVQRPEEIQACARSLVQLATGLQVGQHAEAETRLRKHGGPAAFGAAERSEEKKPWCEKVQQSNRVAGQDARRVDEEVRRGWVQMR